MDIRRRRFALPCLLIAVLLALAACGGGSKPKAKASAPTPSGSAAAQNLYAHTNVGMFQPATQNVPYRLYVPNHGDGTVSVIDPVAKKVIDTYKTGPGAQHVVPSWDLKTLWVNNNENGNSLTPIDPKTAKRRGPNVPIPDPYNMYFTPDGKYGIVVQEALKKLAFVDPQTIKPEITVPVKCAGLNHIDFNADGSYFIATCEFSGQLVKVDNKTHKVIGYLDVGMHMSGHSSMPMSMPDGSAMPNKMGMPQDIKIDPAGKTWYVSDMNNNGVWVLDGDNFKITGFLPTGPETHGLYPSRDAKVLYISNRGGMGPGGDKGSVSVLDFASKKIVATWQIPPPSTPDMGGVSPDGKVLWLSGRRNNEVYGIDTATGKLVARIKVGTEPHGLAVWPQPGRYSLGHTGILR